MLEEMKIKIYEHQARLILPIISILPVGVFFVSLFVDPIKYYPYNIIFMISSGICAILLIFFTVFLPQLSKTYDVYTKNGIKRMKEDNVIFHISWDDVDSIEYCGWESIVILSPHVLMISLKVDKHRNLPQYLMNSNSKDFLMVHMKRKDFDYINKMLIPENVLRK